MVFALFADAHNSSRIAFIFLTPGRTSHIFFFWALSFGGDRFLLSVCIFSTKHENLAFTSSLVLSNVFTTSLYSSSVNFLCGFFGALGSSCLLYTSPSPRD